MSIRDGNWCHWCRHDRNVHNLYGCDEYTAIGGCYCPYTIDGKRALPQPTGPEFQLARGGPLLRRSSTGELVPREGPELVG